MRRVGVGGGTYLAVDDLGIGPPVVLVAGFGLDHTIWDRQVALLAESGCRVVAVDQRGHGDSDKPLNGYDLPTLVDDLAAVLIDLGLGADDGVTVVGHSFGGQVGFGLAARAPQLVERLVLVGSNGVRASRSEDFPFGAPAGAVLPTLLEDERRDRIGARRRTLTSAFASSPSEDLVEWLLSTSLRMPTWAAAACYRSMLTSDQIAEVPNVRQPVLQVVGHQDPMFSINGARWLEANLPNSILVGLDGCGHYPMFEAPEAFEAALLDFVLAGEERNV